MEKILIDNLKNEFYDDIKNCKVGVEDLKKFNCGENSMSAEIFLKSIYGEDIIIDEDIKTDVDLTKKKIEKVDLNELGKISELTNYINDIPKSEFNEKLDIVMSKIKSESDDDEF